MTAFGRRIRAGSARRNIILRLLLILLIISAVFVWILRSPTFKISQVNISWDEPKFLLPEAEARLRNLLSNQLIFGISEKKVLKGVADFPVIENIKITKRYPSTVNSNLTTRKPILALIPLAPGQDSASSSAQLYLLDSSGQVFWKDTGGLGQALPKLLVFNDSLPKLSQFIHGEYPTSALRFFLEFEKSKPEDTNQSIKYLAAPVDGPLSLKMERGVLIFLPSRDSYGELVNSLRLILNKYQIEGKHLKKVDLRFKNPVVEY